MQLVEAHASVVAVESHEIAMLEALKEAKDRHVHQLEEAYLITRAKPSTLATERQYPLTLEGIPIHPPERRRAGAAIPLAPPPSEVSEVEPLFPLTQPLPRAEADP